MGEPPEKWEEIAPSADWMSTCRCIVPLNRRRSELGAGIKIREERNQHFDVRNVDEPFEFNVEFVS
jgi:hypothetical protein